MQKNLFRLLIVVFTGTAIVTVSWLYTRPKPLQVSTRQVEIGIVESVVANTRAGTIEACRRARLAPATGGQIANLPVHEGDHVQAQQVLLEMWNEDLKAELRFAEQKTVAAKALSKETCLRAALAEREAARLEKLYKQKLASEEDTDHAAGQAQASRAACTAAQESSKVNEARTAAVQVALDRSVLRAPFNGIIAEVNGEVGEFVTPSPVGVLTLPVIDLIDNSCLYIAAPIDEVDAPTISPGMSARITLDAFKQHQFPGKVRRVAPYVLDLEKQARTVDIEVEFAHSIGEQNLLPGYSADVEVILKVNESTLRIPTEAVLEGGYVYKVNSEYIVEKIKIETGISNWIYTEVLSGLTTQDTVISSVSLEGLKSGIEVQAKP